MNEAETRAELIDPALAAAGWGVLPGTQVRREFRITLGRLEGNGRRGNSDSADYVLVYKNTKLAVIEAKQKDAPDTAGVGQAKDYANKLAIRFTYATNGQKIYGIDMDTGKEGYVEKFPSPEELYERTFPKLNNWRERFSAIPYPDKSGTWSLRFYQDIAVSRVLEKIAAKEKRVLLTLATGTGKTSIAFQIAWKLFSSRWNLSGEPTRRPRILFLADRNTLADQAYNDFSSFSAFSEDALVRIKPNEISTKGTVPKNGNIFFTIFQTFMSGLGKDKKPAPYFGQYPKDFFDLIVVDECHRGGANDESTWRDILEYFSPAVQLGLTATPKRNENIDTYAYFGEPVYIYSLKDGINDGFLTPFKVKKFQTNLDEYTYTSDDYLVEGELEEGQVFTESEINVKIEIKEREIYRVKLFMEQINQAEKTLVFCANQNHALLVRDIINQVKTSTNPDYCHRVTADDLEIGERHLRDFKDNEKTIPTILTTSQKLSTGVDARNVRNIVLMRPVRSMIEFKQIIGRGTRLYEGKDYFTIYDYVRAYELFEDREWDGEPIAPEEAPICPRCNNQPCTCPPELREPYSEYGASPNESEKAPCEKCGEIDCNCAKRRKIIVKLSDGKERNITHTMSTSFWHPDGRPISAQEFMELLFGKIPELFKSEEELRRLWSDPTTRKELLAGFAQRGFGGEQLTQMARVIDAEKSDLFDVLAYVAYALPTVSREARAANAKAKISDKFSVKQKAFLDFVLAHYVTHGVDELDVEKLSPLLKLKYHDSLSDALADLGKAEEVGRVFVGFQKYLYEARVGV